MSEQDTTNQMAAGRTSVNGGVLLGAALVALVIGGIAIWWFASQKTDGLQNQQATEETENYPDVVATVNGEAVSGSELAAQVAQAEQNARAQGADTSDPTVRAQIEEQALTALINTKLVLQAAADAGVTASEDAINTQVSTLVSQAGGEDAFQQSLTNAGVTMDGVRADLAQQLTIDAFLRANIDVESISITDEQVAAFYAQLSEGQEDVPPLADVEVQLRQQLLAQAQQAQIGQFIDTLRANADIEVMI